jgi:creatinine amidohydrolase
MFLDELTTREFAEKVNEDSVVIVPRAFIAPPIRYGNCATTRNFPGTISLSFDTMRAVAYDVMSELARNGFRNIVLLSGHAGGMHMSALRLAAKDVVDERDVHVMVVSDYEILCRSGKVGEGDGHSGLLETSRVIAIRPDLVGPDRPKGENKMPPFVVLRHPEKYWKEGVTGDSSGSTAEKGRDFNDYVVIEMCRMIKEMRGLE